MEQWISAAVTLIVALLASGGFWTWLSNRSDKKDETKEVLKEVRTDLGALRDDISELNDRTKVIEKRVDMSQEVLKGLSHNEICRTGQMYLDSGYVTQDEYENLHDYIYTPYKKLGGNGSGDKIMEDVRNLPMRG